MQLIKFGAIWCPACLVMSPRYNKIKEELNIDMVCYDYDIDEDMVNQYHIGNILPVLIVLDENNKELTRIIGEKKENEIKEIISRFRK